MKKKVSIYELQIGSSLADDIKARDGQTLISKGVVLNEKHLDRLRQWFAGSDYKFTIEVNEDMEEPKNVQMENLQSKAIDFINDVFKAEGADLDRALSSIDLSLFNICEDLKTISDLPDDVIKIMYHNKPGSHYFRVTRMAVALASIYNKDKPKDMQIPLNSICLSALLHDFGKRYKNDPNGLRALPFNASTLKGTTINPKSIGGSYDDNLHSVYSYVAFKDKLPDEVRRTILYCNYEDFNSRISVKPDVKAASIISLCDVYDTLLEHAMGNDLLSPFENVISYMSQLAHNGKIDKDTYKMFIDHFTIYPHGVKVLLSNGQEAIVVGKSKQFPTKPSVLVIDNRGTNVIDLSETTNITIRRVLQDDVSTDSKVSTMQDRQLQSAVLPVDVDEYTPKGDTARTLELDDKKSNKQKVLDKKLKDFFGR